MELTDFAQGLAPMCVGTMAADTLTLNRNNNRYYEDYLVPLGHLPRRGIRASEHLLRKAFEFYDRRVSTFLEAAPSGGGMRLAQLVEGMSDRLFFTVITVTDELNAYKVFETLNARGVRLSATDLLKNYLFSVLARDKENDHELRTLEDRWEVMVGRLQAEDPAEQERTYNAVAQSFARGGTLNEALPGLASIYPSDTAFRDAFAEKSIRTKQARNNRVVRYILCELERHSSGQDLDFTSDSFGIEHVLPQNPQSGWESFSDDESEALAYRLGNMTLLQSGANRDLSNASYAAKRPIYEHSGFAITRKLAADHADWTPEHLASHQSWMAKQATSIWRIAQLS